jgi:predicted Zn-ribbon and HTH transcriptional regulator
MKLTIAQKSLIKSSVSMAVAYARTLKTKVDENQLRTDLEMAVLETLDREINDTTNWEKLTSRPYYEDYLYDRETSMTVSKYDYVRTGLLLANFGTAEEYAKHKDRINSAEETILVSDRVCQYCGMTKTTLQFPRGIGSRCSACKAKQYRENVKRRGA